MSELTVMTHSSIIDSIDLHAIQETMKKIRTFQSLIHQSLVQDLDYGVIPGVNKPTLYKPGGEKICMLLGINPVYEIILSTEDFKADFFSYNIRCTLYKNDRPYSQGIGSCNSKEKKYRYINVPELPRGYAGSYEEVATRYGEIRYKIENNDICSLVNTILKMAKKRAFIDAVLQVASLSEIFTQDVEDMKEFIKEEQREAVDSMTPTQAGNIKLNFGKHKGETLREVFKNNNGYIEWLLKSDRTAPNIKKACEMLLEAYEANKKVKKAEAEAEIKAEQEPESDSQANGDMLLAISESIEMESEDLPF